MAVKKEGLDYFPFSVDLLEDEKLDILREDYGVVANDVYISLLCLLYKKKGYYIPYETDIEKKDCVWFIYKRVRGGRYPVQQNAIPAVIESLVSQGLFSGRYFPKIITSERAQRTYYSATVERKADSLDIRPEYWLLSIEDMEKLSKKHPYYLSCTKNSQSTDLGLNSTDLNLNEIKGNETNITPNPLQGGGCQNWKDRFFETFPVFERKNYKDDGVNYEVLYQEFKKSSTLQKMWSFPKVVKLYPQIANGDFRDRETEQQRIIQSINDKGERERYYSILNSKAQTIADKNLEKARLDPRFKKVEKELAVLEISLAKAELYNPSECTALKEKKSNLLNEKISILSKLGLKEEDLKPKWQCVYCSDTGWLPNGKACNCYQKIKN